MINDRIEVNIAGGLDIPIPKMLTVRQKFDAPTAMTIGGSLAIAATALLGQRLLLSFGIGTSLTPPSQKLGTTTESAT